jgi:Ras-related protein Rab-1A
MQRMYGGAHGIFLMYDISDHQSFHDIQHWYSEMFKHAKPGVLLVLVGLKIDIPDVLFPDHTCADKMHSSSAKP